MITTERLHLRPWQPEELPLLVAWNADPHIMRHFGVTRTAEQTAARFALMAEWQEQLGFSFWAMERRADGRVIGTCGLKPLTVPWPDTTDIEIGWLLAADCEGQGYASEAAAAVLAHGLELAPRVIAMTAATNHPSERVMHRIGMQRLPDRDFDHPDVPEGHVCRPHIVYAASR